MSPHLLEGRSVIIVGFGCQDPYKQSDKHCTPLVTGGSVIKAVCTARGQLVMLVTTAVLLPGMSGGLVIDTLTGEPLAMAISNSK